MELAGDIEERRSIRTKLRERGCQSRLVKVQRNKSPGQIVRVLDCVAQQPADLARRGGFARDHRDQLASQRGAERGNAGQFLAKSVMQFPTDTFPLAIQSGQDFLLEAFLPCDVPGDGINLPQARQRGGRPLQPYPRAVFALVAIFKLDCGCAGGEFAHLHQRRRAIIGMHKVEKCPGLEFLQRPSQGRLPCRVQALEPAIETGDADKVGRVREKMEQLLVRGLPGDREKPRGHGLLPIRASGPMRLARPGIPLASRAAAHAA